MYKMAQILSIQYFHGVISLFPACKSFIIYTYGVNSLCHADFLLIQINKNFIILLEKKL